MAVQPRQTAEISVTARKMTASFLRVYLALSLWGMLNMFVRGDPLKHIGPLIHNRNVPEGSSVDLSCELSNSTVQVTLWQMLRSGGMYTPRKNVVKWGQIFTLQGASKSIEGTYLCRSRRPRFTVRIGSVLVTPKLKDPPQPSVDQREKTVLVNGDVNLTCKATGTGISSVQWYRWARKLSLQHQVFKKEAGINGETWTNILMLKNAQMNRAGWYECRVFKTGQSYGFWSAYEKLKVLGNTECPELGGDFADPQRTTGYLRCTDGKSTRMNCSEGMVWRDDKKVCGTPAKVIKWKSVSGFKEVAKTVGESITFDCRLSDPAARVKLRQKVFSGGFIERFADGCRLSREGQRFVIHSVNFNDFGIYYCEAPQVKIRRKEEAFLKIKPAPISALRQGYRNLFVAFGSSLDLNCGALSVFQPRMYLELIRMDGITELIPDGYKVTLKDRIITIHEVNSTMYGKIVCKVVSSCARAREDVDLGFLLPVPGKGEPPIPVISSQFSVVKEGDNLVVKCSVSKDKEIHTIEWYKDKKRVTGNVVMSAFESILRLNNVTKADAGDYECRVRDFGAGYWHKTASVTVEELKTTPSQNISVTIKPSTQVTATPPVIAILLYQPVDISCAMFRPDMQFTLWQESSPGTIIQRIPDGFSLIRQGNEFTITQARSTDKGTYYCQADGSRKVFSAVLTHAADGISASSNRSVWIPNASPVIDYNGGANIVCIVQSIIPAHWSMWLKTGKEGHNEKNVTDKHIVVAKTFRWFTELVLQIRDATEEDAGTYTCRANLGSDTDEQSAHLTVKALTKAQVLLYSGSQVVKESQSAKLWCKVGGSPQPKVTWQKRGQPLGECSLRWGAVNCRSFSERHSLTFSKGTSFLRVSTTNFYKDGGAYSCHVENLAGSENVTSQLTIQVKPSILKNTSATNESIMIIQSSDSVSLSCNIRRGIPSPIISWWNQTCAKDSTECKPSSQGWRRMETDNTSSLLIPPNQEHALYRCTAENWLGHDDIIYTILRQPDVKPPNIINFMPRTSANASQTTKLVCEMHDHAAFADVEWFKDGAQVGSCAGRLQQNKTCCLYGDEAKYTITWTGSGAELTIKNLFHPFDSGNFTCVITNAAGVDTKTITLDVFEKPLLNKKNDTDYRVLAFGTATTIQSTALRGHPRPFFKWFQQPITACATSCKPDAKKWRRVYRSVSPSAHVRSRMSSLFLPPTSSGYFFRCIAENSLGHDDAVYMVHRIATEAILPEIIPHKTELQVDERSSFKLQCQARAGDFQHLTWQKRNSGQPLSKLTQNQHNLTNTLSIRNAHLEDAGDYLCVGWTNNDTKISMITVVVKEFIAPLVSLSNKTIHESQTNKTILRCALTSGYPKPNITWYKDDVKLSLHALGTEDACRINGYHYMVKHPHPATEHLVICKPSHMQNTGLYKCLAENLVGEASSEGFLNVLAPPKIVNMKDTVATDLGENVNVTCKATGNPSPSVKWVTKTEDGRHAPVTQSDDKNQTLRINFVQEHHYGVYVCVAENRFGNDTVALALVKRTVGAIRGLQSSSKVTFIVAIVVSVVLFILLLIFAAILYRRRQLYDGFYICTSPPLPDLIARLDSSIPLIEQVNKLPYDKRWEFPREHLQFGKVIGSGAFGEVYLAEVDGNIITDNSAAIAARPRLSTKKDLRRGSTASVKGPIKVAVKTLKGGADETEHKDLQSELKILIHIGSHKNIVNLLGACTRGRYCDLCVIIEYCPYGNMLLFLRNRRGIYDPKWLPPTDDPDKQFTMTDLVSAAFQVARAMEFLASRKCVHRDLAARNVLVASNYVVKVADFGLARDVYKDDQYIKVSPGLVPVKWMAIESLTDRVYSEQSDVWSFGVFLWELFTLGGSPYPGLPPTEIYQFIIEGNRMDHPVDCPDQMYFMMRDCWMEKAADRPNFTALVQRLDNIIASNMTAMGHEGYLELGLDESIMPSEETDHDGYLKPVEIMSSACNKHALLLNGSLGGSSKELRGSHRSVASESKIKASLEVERYTELGFKPSSSANTLSETIL